MLLTLLFFVVQNFTMPPTELAKTANDNLWLNIHRYYSFECEINVGSSLFTLQGGVGPLYIPLAHFDRGQYRRYSLEFVGSMPENDLKLLMAQENHEHVLVNFLCTEDASGKLRRLSAHAAYEGQKLDGGIFFEFPNHYGNVNTAYLQISKKGIIEASLIINANPAGPYDEIPLDFTRTLKKLFASSAADEIVPLPPMERCPIAPEPIVLLEQVVPGPIVPQPIVPVPNNSKRKFDIMVGAVGGAVACAIPLLALLATSS